MEAKWLFATKNPYKLKEAQTILGNEWVLEGLPPEAPEAPEPYETLYANALSKAAFYASWARVPVLAEDSGLFVPALGGQPGVFSARYGGPQRLLKAMEGVAHRNAYFVAVLVAYFGNAQYHFYTGYCFGMIAREMRGEGGFGYDPIFIPAGSEHTVAELGEAWKKKYSHRAIAFQRFVEGWTKQ
ncbi:MAG: RdgB/HAM1 family non-canonical purine NTP pyrophosphatase [Bacteroidia bacterium]|nr:RdgB/HAM1 family non-canonical purine NTP pyrophosphatase [Bacteroidia bacterium]MDW8133479.1 RdgB/HAM1 family non-canonical purine NTP pyrophosphatase [Bacteroidia bacterium]